MSLCPQQKSNYKHMCIHSGHLPPSVGSLTSTTCDSEGVRDKASDITYSLLKNINHHQEIKPHSQPLQSPQLFLDSG